MARHLAFDNAQLAFDRLIEFAYTKGAMGSVVDEAVLPSITVISEETLLTLEKCDNDLQQFFTAEVCKSFAPHRWVAELTRLRTLDKRRSHTDIKMNEPVASYYRQLQLEDEPL